MHRKTFIKIGLLYLLGLTNCRQNPDVKIVKLGHGLDINHSVHKALVKMRDELNKIAYLLSSVECPTRSITKQL